MHHSSFRCAPPVLVMLAFLAVSNQLASPAIAQDTLPAPVGTSLAYALDSGERDNLGESVALVYSKTISLPGAGWLRLHFSIADLHDGSFLLVTSTRDGETHRLDAAAMTAWSNSTAYLNGDTLDLQLFAAPRSRGTRVSITSIEAGLLSPTTRGDASQCGICNTDDRTPSTENWTGRIMPIGCTGSIIDEGSTMISAGHCAGTGQVLQFNVPNSSASCATTNPPVADQFPVTVLSSLNGGVGNDWSVYHAGANSLGQRPFQRYGQLRRVAAMPADVGAASNVFGYGLDLTCATSQTQRHSPGSITQRSGTYYAYDNDVRGGNSGSAFLSGGAVAGIVTHCSSSCGGNIATRIDIPALAAAINSASAGNNSVSISFTATLVWPVISISPTDLDGSASGAVPFLRNYRPGTQVSAVAPTTISSVCFHGWRVNDIDQGPNPALSLNLDASTVVEARYSVWCCPADRDDGLGRGISDGTVDVNDLLYFLVQFEAGTPAADLDDGSGTGTPDRGTDASDVLFFLTRFEAGC